VPNAQRAELLVHYELMAEWRAETKCQGCGKKHQEWFEIGQVRAAEVVADWAAFFTLAKPYDKAGVLEPQWRDIVEKIVNDGGAIRAKVMLAHYQTRLVSREIKGHISAAEESFAGKRPAKLDSPAPADPLRAVIKEPAASVTKFSRSANLLLASTSPDLNPEPQAKAYPKETASLPTPDRGLTPDISPSKRGSITSSSSAPQSPQPRRGLSTDKLDPELIALPPSPPPSPKELPHRTHSVHG
jgi:hypothetical protein